MSMNHLGRFRYHLPLIQRQVVQQLLEERQRLVVVVGQRQKQLEEP
jgi:hypothetical protein